MIKVKEITLSNLYEAFALAQEGFNLNKKKSERIFDYIYNSNLSINFFGYSLYSNKKLAGVLFAPFSFKDIFKINQSKFNPFFM